MTHTPGPLRFAKQGSGFQFSAGKIMEPSNKLIGFISGVTKWHPGEAEANAHRIVAAWNACEGISTEALEAGAVADLLTACEKTMAIALEIGERAVKVSRTSHGKFAAATVKDDASRYIRGVKAAIAKVKG